MRIAWGLFFLVLVAVAAVLTGCAAPPGGWRDPGPGHWLNPPPTPHYGWSNPRLEIEGHPQRVEPQPVDYNGAQNSV